MDSSIGQLDSGAGRAEKQTTAAHITSPHEIDGALGEWARKIRVWRRGGNPAGARLIGPAGPARAAGRDVFVYFDNDVKTRAPYDAMTLAHLLGVGPKAPAAPPVEANAKTARPNWPAYPSMRKSATGKSPGARRRSRAIRKTL